MALHLLLNVPNQLKNFAGFGPAAIKNKISMALGNLRPANLVAFQSSLFN
jgi:hypothetical protein